MITKTQIAKYVFLPGILPRIKELKLNSGWLAYLMALIFAATRVLPANHPYVAASQQGKFGISDILFEAGRHLKGGLRNIDQYLIYGSFVLGIILLIGQFAILLFVIVAHTANAAMPDFNGMFVTMYPRDDVALMMLDKVFEIPNMFGSKFDPAITGQISPFGTGLHAIILFYNQGMLIIAGLIVVYYIFAVIIETMQTGTPFGQRFQEVFVPIRIVIAILLLIPLGYGLSAGQMMVLKLADWGSAFATNGWLIFNQRAGLNPLGTGAAELVVSPKTQEIEDLLRYYSLVHSCRAIYKLQYNKEIKPYIIYNQGNTKTAANAANLSYDTAQGRFGKDNIKVTYGEYRDGYTNYPGKVKPYCGSINLTSVDEDIPSAGIIQDTYWTFLQILWTDQDLNAYGNRMAQNFSNKTDVSTDNTSVDGWSDPKGKPDEGFYANVRTVLQSVFNANMQAAKDQIRNDPDSNIVMTKEMLKTGWGGAGIWFNKVAEYNGSIISASTSVPVPSAYPSVMQWTLAQKMTTQGGLSALTQFTSSFGDGASLKDMMSGAALDNPTKDGQIGKFLGDIYGDMTKENTYGDGTEAHDDNIIANMFGMMFGTEGLSELRGNQQIHPLAKMSALGRSIIDRAIMYMGGAMVMGGLSGLSTFFDKATGANGFSQAFSALGSMFISFSTIGITVGIVLYYVIPFLPFLYFFFAVGRWVKSVFEAIIAIPLWALAHLRIDGEGIPGPAAAQGYYLLLEILLRPILVIFGMMAGVACFSALAIALDTVFDLVTSNVTGYTPVDEQGVYSWNNIEFKRGHIDQFFYTIVYAVLLYMMAMSCFKLIDLIPNSVLRFIGTGVNEFNDQLNLEQDMVRYSGLATYHMAPQMAKAGMEFGNAMGQTVALPGNMALELNDARKAQDAQNKANMDAAQRQQNEQTQQDQQRQQQEQAQRQQQEQARQQAEADKKPPVKDEAPAKDLNIIDKAKIAADSAVQTVSDLINGDGTAKPDAAKTDAKPQDKPPAKPDPKGGKT